MILFVEHPNSDQILEMRGRVLRFLADKGSPEANRYTEEPFSTHPKRFRGAKESKMGAAS